MRKVAKEIESAMYYLYDAIYEIEDSRKLENNNLLAVVEHDLEAIIGELVEIQKRLGRK